jgi:hypothetical protein
MLSKNSEQIWKKTISVFFTNAFHQLEPLMGRKPNKFD